MLRVHLVRFARRSPSHNGPSVNNPWSTSIAEPLSSTANWLRLFCSPSSFVSCMTISFLIPKTSGYPSLNNTSSPVRMELLQIATIVKHNSWLLCKLPPPSQLPRKWGDGWAKSHKEASRGRSAGGSGCERVAGRGATDYFQRIAFRTTRTNSPANPSITLVPLSLTPMRKCAELTDGSSL